MSQFQTAIDRIHHGRNPYENFPTDTWKGHMVTWGNTHPWFEETINTIRPKVIVEVGAFLGGSVIHMAKIIHRLNLDCAILAVDTWLGAIDHLSQLHAELHYRWGRPSTYMHFMANVIESGCQNIIVPVPADSLNACRWIKHHGITAQMVYIDGSHEEGDVYRDLSSYYIEILEPGGAMLVDDMIGFQSVVKDTRKFADALELDYQTNAEKARFWKPRK